MIARLLGAPHLGVFPVARFPLVRWIAGMMSASNRILVLVAGVLASSSVMASEPLRELIDRELAPPSAGAWPRANDAEFLRRVFLDLNGMPPGADEARLFLSDGDPAKRAKLIDRLLASPLFDRHLSTTLDVMLMERRTNTHVSQDEWQGWLLKSVRDNKPWNVLVREILTADGEDPKTRPAVRFCLDRGTEPNAIARDMGRIFFGRDMQCAQCHDSPLVSDFLQHDYQGLLAIASTISSVTRKIAEKDVAILADRSGSDLTFESVFIKGTAHRTGARVLGEPLLVEPYFLPGEEYRVAPADGVRSVPKFSRRASLAEQATSGSNLAFNENIANRLWAMMLGRGLVHPLDMMHPDNPAASPALLRQLGERFAAMNFDMRAFLREIALSDVYQRPFDLTEDTVLGLQPTASTPTLLDLRSQAAENARVAVAAWDSEYATFRVAEAAMIPVALEVDTVRSQYAEARKNVDEAQKAVADANAVIASKRVFLDTLTQALTSLQRAAAALPSDQALAASAQQLVVRTSAIAAEFPGLEQAAAEKAVAVEAPTAALNSVRTAVESAVLKLQPLLDVVRSTDLATVNARKLMEQTTSELMALDHQIKTLGRLTLVSDRRSTVLATQQSAVIQEAELAAIGQRVAELLPAIAARSAELQAAETAMNGAASALSAAQGQSLRSQASLNALSEACGALAKARAVLVDDTSLAESARLLDSRKTAAATELRAAEALVVTATQSADMSSSVLKSMTVAMDEANTELNRRKTAVADTQTARTLLNETLSAQRAALQDALATVPSDLASRFALSQLKPLTPEQMCWTIFKVTTVYDRTLANEVTELDKATPPTDEQRNDPVLTLARAREIEQRTFDKLKSNLSSYVQNYGGGAGQPQGDFYASADQALFTANGGAINGWIAPAGGNPAERIINTADSRVAAEELYLGILTRMPTEEEITEVAALLSARPDRSRAAQELAWGLISSAEFRFNR